MARTATRSVTLRMGLASLEAKRQLDLQSIPVPNRPRYEFPVLPNDPTDLSDSELMKTFREINRWSEFLGVQKVMAEVDERYAEAALDKGKIVLGVNLKSNDGRAAAAQNEELWALQDEYQQRMAYRKVMEMTYDNAERNSALLSRELTRRVNRSARDGRVERFDT